MTDTVRSDYDDEEITHHVSFEQGETKIGLILCNGKGEPDPRALQQGNMPNRAIQFSQGDPDYSDMELPYTPITQKDWSGGRGQEDFESDKTRYSDSNAIDAMYGDVILGPKVTQAIAAATPYSDINDQESSDKVFEYDGSSEYAVYNATPYNYSESDILYYGLGLPTWTYCDRQFYASRLLADFAPGGRGKKVTTVKFWLAKTNKVTVVMFKYDAIDISTKALRYDLWQAVLHGYETDECTNIQRQTYDIVENSSLTEYEFDFNYTLQGGSYYIIAVISLKGVSYSQTPNSDYQCVFGLNDTSSTLDFKFLRTFSTGGVVPYPDPDVYGTHLYRFYTDEPSLAYEINALDEEFGDAHYFTLRNSLFLVISPPDGSAPSLYKEGYHGWAADNSADPSIIHAVNVGTDAVGAICKIIGGPGSTERIRWRKITAVETGASGYCTVDRDWYIDHTDDTEYAIYGCNKWTEITGHGLTAGVTDVLVVDDIVYFCMGEDVAIRRMRMTNSSKVWTPDYANETAKATFLKLIQNEEGERKIWRALSSASTVSSSDVKEWGTDLDFGDAITCGNIMYRINNIVPYGTPRIPFIMKEDGFGSISDDIYDQIPLSEFAAVADDNNGRAAIQRGVYLYLSLLNGLERYYEGRLDDIGPNRDLGLPNLRNGFISSLLAYPGRMYASIEHAAGYSSILLYNEIGWHEIYRTAYGEKIYSMTVQVMDGDTCDRLYFSGKGRCSWVPIAIDPKKQDDYEYASTGSIETAWISGNFKEINKYFASITVYSENLVEDEQYIIVSYKIDSDDNEWVEIPNYIYTSPSQEIEFPNHNVTGKRIKIKLTLITTDSLITPRVRGITLKPVTRLTLKKSWTMTYKIDDALVDLTGRQSTMTAAEMQAQIETWASSVLAPAPVYMEAPHSLFSGKYVFIEPASLRPIGWVMDNKTKKLKAIVQLEVFEEG